MMNRERKFDGLYSFFLSTYSTKTYLVEYKENSDTIITDQTQTNIFKSAVDVQKIMRSRSIPQVSRISKIQQHIHSSKQQIQSDLTSVKTISVIHTTIGMRKNNDHLPNRRLVEKEKKLQSDGSFNYNSLIRPRQNVLRSSSLIRSDSNRIQPTPSYRSLPPSQLNKGYKDISNRNIPSTHSVISAEQYSYHPQVETKNNPSKTSQIAHSDVSARSQNVHPTILDETKKPKKRSYFKKSCAWLCSLRCMLLSLLIGLILIGAIIGSVVGVLIAFKTTTTTTTTTSIPSNATTVMSTICSCLCGNGSWTFDLDRLARWTFDGTLTDEMNMYDATAVNNPSFVTNGYVNQALFFNLSLSQALSTPYIPLANTSFTIEVWLKPTLFPNPEDQSILGLCPSTTSYQCLHAVIRTIGSNQYLYFGFFNHDCSGNTALTLNQWIHAAFVFDITTLTQSVYLNGILDKSCTVPSPIMAATGNVTIGTVPALIPLIGLNFYQGYMDHLTITNRTKPSCEILEDATLAACFLFNAGTPYTDFGPNSLLSSEVSTSVISSGHSYDAISFNGISSFQTSSFTALGLAGKPFSIILWIRPRSVLGPIVHVSDSSDGRGWCIPFLGITANGSVVAQIYNGTGIVTMWGPPVPMSPVWSHIVQTWSSTNGLRLYINSVLVASQTSAVVYVPDGASYFITLANSDNGFGYCSGGGLGAAVPQGLDCDIDDFRVYSRELTASAVSTIYHSN